MDREILFAQALEKVKKIARGQGNRIGEEQVRDEFAGLDLSDGQLKMVCEYLAAQKIAVGEDTAPEDLLTGEERDYLRDYLDTVEALSPCSGEEADAIAAAAMAGEPSAQRKMVELHLKDVADVARLYAGQGVLLEDLIGEGNLALARGAGLLGSLEKPSEAGGMLIRMMMDAREECIRENAEGKKADRAVEDKVNRVADKARELARELGRKATPEELAREKGLSLKAVLAACRVSGGRIEDIEYADKNL